MSGFLDDRANLSGRKGAIIGGGGGIGAAVTLAFAGAGIDVAFCDIDDAALAATNAAATNLGVAVLAQHADATDAAALDGFYDEVTASFGALDIVVNVVGGVKRRALMETSERDIADDIQRNYGYVIQSVRRAIPLLRQSKRGGSIINFTTIEAHRGAAGFAVYAGAKAATANFTRAMAVELGAERIRLNCIAPDTTPSQGNINAIEPSALAGMAALPEHIRGEGLKTYIPMKAQPSTADLANAVLFLASDLSASVSGMTLHVDGGTMAAAGFLDWPFGDGYLPTPFSGTLSRLFRDD